MPSTDLNSCVSITVAADGRRGLFVLNVMSKYMLLICRLKTLTVQPAEDTSDGMPAVFYSNYLCDPTLNLIFYFLLLCHSVRLQCFDTIG